MDEELNSAKNIAKGVFRTFKRPLIIIIAVAAVIMLILVPSLYIKFKDDLIKISEKNETYSVTVTPQGQVAYLYTDPLTNETKEIELTEMSSDMHTVLENILTEMKNILKRK